MFDWSPPEGAGTYSVMEMAFSGHDATASRTLFSESGGYVTRDGCCVAVDVAELEDVGRDHRAERVPLAPILIDLHFHGVLLILKGID